MEDMTAALQVDTSGWTAPLEESARATEDSGERVIRVVHQQEGSWLAMVTNVVPALSQMVEAISGVAASAYALARQRELLAAVQSSWTLSGAAALQYGRYALSAASYAYPPLKVLTIGITAATLAYKIGSNEIVQNAVAQSAIGQKLSASYDNVTGSLSRVGSSMSEIASTAMQSAEEGLTQIATATVKGAMDLAQYHPTVQTTLAGLNMLADGMDWTAKAIDELNNQLPTIKLYTENLGNVSDEAAQKFYAEGMALKEMAKASEELIAKQEGMRGSYQMLAAIQQQATASAAHQAEVQRLGSLTSMEAITAEERALQSRNDELIRAGKFDEAAQKQAMDLFATLANQKQGVESGRVKPPEEKDSYATQQIAQAEQALMKLQQGEIAVALATAQTKGATEEQIATLKSKLETIDTLKSAQEAQKQIEQQAKQEAEKQDRMREQAADKIAAMRDQVDLLSGAASKADIAMREMARQGFDEEQIAQVGELEAQLEGLQKKNEKTTKQMENPVALKGSEEANKIILRGVTGTQGGPDPQVVKQTAYMKQMADRLDKGLTIELEEITLA